MTVAIIGLGLIGGSIGLDLVAAGHDVVAVDPDEPTRAAAANAGIAVTDLATAVLAADLVVVATPPGVVAAVIEEVVAYTDVPVTDVTSVCDPSALGMRAPLPATWTGGHPMAGTERSGFGAARRGLLVGAPWLIAPHDGSDPASLAAVIDLALGLQTRPLVVSAHDHDELVATVSHLPHLVAFALQQSGRDVGGDVVAALGGPSFRDSTRVAASDPAFWADLLVRNATAVQAAVTHLQSWLDDAMAATGDVARLQVQLEQARRRPGPRRPDPTEPEPIDLAEDDALARLRTAGRQGRHVIDIATVGDAATVRVAPRTHR